MLNSAENQSESDWNPNTKTNEKYFGVAHTKIYIEQMCRFYSKLGLKTTVIRHSNAYGKWYYLLPKHYFYQNLL